VQVYMTILSDNLLIDHQLQYFCSTLATLHRSKQWWTLLILTPLGRQTTDYGNGRGLWMAIATQIHAFMAKASGSWVELADEFEKLLVLDDTKGILLEDEKFSQPQKLFWMLNKIEEILPMITDGIVQWNWFRDSNKLKYLADDDFFEIKNRAGEVFEVKEDQMTALQETLAEMEKIVQRLEDSKSRFEAIRERARSLRDGVRFKQHQHTLRL
jgi:hypothetical protein